MATDRFGMLFARTTVLTTGLEQHAVPLWQPTDSSTGLRECYQRFLLPALRFLPPEQQTVIRLYYLQGERIPSISARLGVSRSTVSRRLRAGTNTLRRLARLCIDAGFLPP